LRIEFQPYRPSLVYALASVAVLLCVTRGAFGGAIEEPPQIRSVRADKAKSTVWDRVTLRVDVDASFKDPFDPKQIRIDAVVALPGGDRLRVPGFYYQAFRTVHADHERFGKVERLERVGEPTWMVRYAAPVPGRHEIVIEASDAAGTTRSKPLTLDVAGSDAPGMVRLPKDKAVRYFVTDRGESFYPVGYNIYGASGRTWVADMERWLGKMGENGCNFARIWMYYTFFRWSEPGRKGVPPYDHIDLGWAWRYDRVMEAAERSGIRIQLCLDTHHPFMASKGWGLDKIGFHKRHGGPLSNPHRVAPGLFTNPQCREAYRRKLRYVVARYGYSTSVFAWEFWNEIGCVPGAGGSRKQIRAWHTEMARYLRQVDPWNHLITSSSGIPANCPGLDFNQPHRYGAGDPVRSFDLRRSWRPGHRRTFWGEAWPLHTRGYPHPSPVPKTIKLDPDGQWIHDYCFSSPGLGHPATPMSWYHRSYIEKQDLFKIYKPFSRWIAGYDFAGQRAVPFGRGDASASPRGLLVLGVRGRTECLVWIQNRTLGWAWQVGQRKKLKPIDAATLTLKGLAEGAWIVDTWDTCAAKITGTQRANAGKDGVLKIPVGPVARDVALRLRLP
jgi:hypothetical protein